MKSVLYRYLLGLWMLLGAVFGASAQTAQPTAEHILGSGDVIRITVYQSPDLSLETRISERGQITFPLIGEVMLGGMTLTGAQDRIAKALKDGNFVIKPQVTVMLTQVRSSQISILGQVARPGRYPIEIANSKVSEMIAVAGGITPTGADVLTLVGTRSGKPVKFEVDLPQILQSGKTELDVVVQNGDIVYVDRAPNFYMYGEVQRPGVFRLERGITVVQALAQSGGLTARGTIKGMRVQRKNSRGAVEEIELKMSDVVQQDDVIYVRESVF